MVTRLGVHGASHSGVESPRQGGSLHWAVVATVAASWLLLVAAEVTGSGLLDHDALFESGRVGAAELGLFFVGWQLMVVAMMLPASFPAIRAVGPRPLGTGAFLAGFGVVWTVFAWAALSIDSVVHRAVERLPWLEARPGLLAAGLLVLVGLWQFTPQMSRCLAACRSWAPVSGQGVSPRDRAADGVRYGQLCLACDAGLMLVMFAVGGSAAWMAVLALAMVGQRWLHGGVHRWIGAIALGAAVVVGVTP